MTRITVLGSSNTDLVVKLPGLPKPGETVIGGTFTMSGGGKGANQAVAAARAGGHVTFLSRIGSDTFGKQSMTSFELEGLDCAHIRVDDELPSGMALIMIDRTGENMIGVASGANAAILPEHVEQAMDAITTADIFLTQLEVPIPAVERAINGAAAAGVPVVLNPAPARSLPAGLLSKVNVLTPNETEAGTLTGIEALDEAGIKSAAEELLRSGARSVIVTLGARGLFVADQSHAEFTPAFDVKPVDTTAAGDVFSGALAVALSERATLREAALFASAAAALSVTRLGAQPSAPRRSEIDGFMRNR